jgi:formylglycine-generating enzyme required for sulfatase activity
MKTDNNLFPPCFPESWAQSYGQDNLGLWQGIYIDDIELRFRWMPPREFMMGSPEKEPERYYDEGPQHRVAFEDGFWLAETACTQQLWLLVMGDNPARFQGDNLNPVENITWEMAQKFISAVNSRSAGLNVRLPSEAEWEYACRAGTTTPFWFGEELTPDDANYNGTHPYNNGKKGEYREQTMPVKSFQPNLWGLYQMHGNVWEWCQDRWHDNYKGAPQDGSPWEEGGEENRAVCRGGSWFNYGRYLRSTCRNYDFIGLDVAYFGFRLAQDSEQLRTGTAR